MTSFGRRVASAMFKASRTSWLCKVVAIAQPTTRRLNASSVNRQAEVAVHVGTKVISATHSRFVPSAVKLLADEFGAPAGPRCERSW